MRQVAWIVAVAASLAATTAGAQAQPEGSPPVDRDAGWRWTASMGASVTTAPLVLVSDGSRASINLTSAPTAHLEVDHRMWRQLRWYVGGTVWAPQLTHSDLLEVSPYPSRPVYQATSVIGAAGLQWLPRWRLLLAPPTFRLGVGYKARKLDVPRADFSAELTGDVGVGWRIPLSDRGTEAVVQYRFAPSFFNPAVLPIRLGVPTTERPSLTETEGKQNVQDHFIQIGVRWRP